MQLVKLQKDICQIVEPYKQITNLYKIVLEKEIMYKRFVNANMNIFELNEIDITPRPKNNIIVNVYIN